VRSCKKKGTVPSRTLLGSLLVALSSAAPWTVPFFLQPLAARKLLALLLLALIGPSLSGLRAYYHFVHYPSDTVGERIVEKFDLADLTDQSVYFFVSRTAPRTAANDSYEALISQIRQALNVWDAISTSALGVKFGGLAEAPMTSASPAGEIIFAELPPGVIGLGGPVTRGAPVNGAVPIIRSQVILSNDLTTGARARPSFSELFFTSLVHEIGHALGLQHTLTSSVMSTDVTRSTTRALPLGLDDAAGLSVLYPSDSFHKTTGSIAGRVTTNAGVPVHLASVVAIGGGDLVVSALTDPDGTYRIDGLVPGEYLLYAHPLPPATQDGLGPANIVLPTNAARTSIAAGGPFTTIFLGGTQHPTQDQAVAVRAGQVTADNDFRVIPRNAPSLFNVTTFSFPGNGLAGVHPAFLDVTRPTGFILATGPNLTNNLDRVQLEVLGENIPLRRPRAYSFDARFARIDFALPIFGSLAPKHLLFRTADDIYVLPGAVRFTAGPAPVIHWMTQKMSPDGQIVWSIQGENFDPLSTVYFDGLPAETLAVFPLDNEIWVEPPGGASGRRAVVMVYNSDGQSSAFTLPDGNVTFAFSGRPIADLQLSPNSAAADTDIVVRVRGTNTDFIAGETIVGFGTSDIVTRAVNVISPTELIAAITVRPKAQPGAYMLSGATGLSVMARAGAFLIEDSPIQPSDRPRLRFGSLLNSATMTTDLSPGVWASLFGTNLVGPAAAAVRVTLNGESCRIFSATENQINLQIPFSVAVGVALLEVDNGRATSEPMLVQIQAVSPGLFPLVELNGDVTSNPPVLEHIAVQATGLGVPSSSDASNPFPTLAVLFNGQRFAATSVSAAPDSPGLYRIVFRFPKVPFDARNSRMAIVVAGRQSNAIQLSIPSFPPDDPDPLRPNSSLTPVSAR